MSDYVILIEREFTFGNKQKVWQAVFPAIIPKDLKGWIKCFNNFVNNNPSQHYVLVETLLEAKR